MGNEFDKALRYIFILSFLLIVVAYWAGSQKVLTALSATGTQLLYSATGRNPSGTAFLSYPTGA